MIVQIIQYKKRNVINNLAGVLLAVIDILTPFSIMHVKRLQHCFPFEFILESV